MLHINHTTKDPEMERAELFEGSGVDMFEAPIPGESLTSDPENPNLWETPPELSTEQDAIHSIFMHMTDEESYPKIVDSMRDKVPIDMIAQVYLFKGFQDGKWSVDLMLLLIEPTVYILMWLAEQAGVTDAVLDSDGDNWEEEEDMLRTDIKEDISRMKPEPKMPDSLLSKMDEFKSKVAGEL